MKAVSFPAMAESGWLTRSLEQAHPYTLDYPGKITPKIVKEAFLEKIITCRSVLSDMLNIVYSHSGFNRKIYITILS